MVEKRSSGSARSRGLEGGLASNSPTASPTASPPGSPRRSGSRRRVEIGASLSPHTLVKPLLASAYVYVTVAALAWELWRRRTAAGEDSSTAGGPPVEAGSAPGPGSAPASGPEGAPAPVFSHGGQPLALGGDFVAASCDWLDPGIQGIVGDQRHREAVGLLPRQLRAGDAALTWHEVFELVLRDGRRVRARDCNLAARTTLKENGGLERAVLLSGESLSLRCRADLEVQWSASLLRLPTGSEVLRTSLSFRSSARGAAADVSQLTLWAMGGELACPGGANASETAILALGQEVGTMPGPCFQLGGSVDGSPLVGLRLGAWLAVEHPRGAAALRNGTLEASLAEPLPETTYFASLGSVGPTAAAAEGAELQDSRALLRRHFHAYLRELRAPPAQPHLHYASWYDLRRAPCTDSSQLGKPFCGQAEVLSEQKAMDRLLSVHLELSRRGVPLDGLLLDDGWDDAELPWRAERRNFPVGLGALAATASARGASVGAWLSPWGGVGEGGKRRLRAGLAQGFESYGDALRLSGPKYYEWFRQETRSLVLESGLRFLKFDGLGAGLGARGAGRFAADVDRLLHLCTELRAESPQLRLGVSTGSWPSPFWLLATDAVWRGGPDLGKEGAGSPAQQWITFRDAMVYQWVATRAPLFPLASLALGGVVWSKAEEPGAYLGSYSLDDFVCEVWSFFFTGVSWQELLIQPALLTPLHWDVLANVANLSRHHTVTLRDAHWIGGNPGIGEVYGYASFACPPCLGLLSWRNPRAESQNVTFTLREALSLPSAWPGGAAAGRWRLRGLWPLPTGAFGGAPAAETPLVEAWAKRPLPSWDHVALDESLHLELAGLELRVLEALPLKP